MSDIADQAGVTRAIVYLHYDSKESLFEALLLRETRAYLGDWLSALERSPDGGTIADVFRSSLYAVQRSPFLSALMQQDRHIFGKYLHKSGNIFAPVQSGALWPELITQLQSAGAVRQDVQPVLMGHILNALALGMIEMEKGKAGPETPPFDALLAATADMLDRVLTPEGGGNQAAGREIILQLARAIQTQFEAVPAPQD